MSEKQKYQVTIKTKEGSCDTSLFEKMAKNGDITAVKLNELIGAEVKILGYAECEITTEEKNNNEQTTDDLPF